MVPIYAETKLYEGLYKEYSKQRYEMTIRCLSTFQLTCKNPKLSGICPCRFSRVVVTQGLGSSGSEVASKIKHCNLCRYVF